MHFIICDDEPQILSYIAEKVRNYMPESTTTEVDNPAKLQNLLQTQDCDVLLLDIDMPQITGLEIAEALQWQGKKLLLVFVTGHDELVYDSLKFHPFGFVRKSFLDTELPRILADCAKEVSRRSLYYHFHAPEGEVKLLLEDILYLEAEGNYLKVYGKDKEYRFRDTLTNVQSALEKHGFVRVHRGFLVNQAAVEILGTEEVQLINGVQIPIGRNYAETSKRQIMRFMLR